MTAGSYYTYTYCIYIGAEISSQLVISMRALSRYLQYQCMTNIGENVGLFVQYCRVSQLQILIIMRVDLIKDPYIMRLNSVYAYCIYLSVSTEKPGKQTAYRQAAGRGRADSRSGAHSLRTVPTVLVLYSRAIAIYIARARAGVAYCIISTNIRSLYYAVYSYGCIR